MNVSYNWLRRYIQTDLPAVKVAEILTSIGLEVGSVEQVQTIRGGLEGLVVGKVLTCEAHPNSDHLHVTTVDVGGAAPLGIVCGAPNVAAGQTVVVATVGTTLYDGDKPFLIKPSKLRGVASNGMICAEDEIGVGTDHSGIIVLPDNLKPGTPAKEYYHPEEDWVIEVDITPNRADAASHYGVARDLAAALTARGIKHTLSRPAVDKLEIPQTESPVTVRVHNAEACPRYTGLVIRGVKIAPSPEWLQKALRSIGLNPINNVVDVTNYILFALGQPLHAFDLADVKGGVINVRTGLGGVKFTTLDGKERILDNDDLMICDEAEPMCIAGVFGGLQSGIKETTTDMFLECAWFNPVFIRKTARRHQLSTDASFRYERGTDPDNTVYAIKRAATLIMEVAGGHIDGGLTDVYPSPQLPFNVQFSRKRCASLIGKEIPEDTLQTILRSLEIKVKADDGERMELLVPPYRVDVTREADVVEDVLRIYGYDNVEIPQTVRGALVYAQKPEPTKVEGLLAAMLTAQGYREIMCNTLTKAAYYEGFECLKPELTVTLANPLSQELGALRQNLLFGALETTRHNRNRKNTDLRLFEFGNVHRLKNADADRGQQTSFAEEWHLSLLITGQRAEANWVTPASMTSFADIKTAVGNVIARMGLKPAAMGEEPTRNDFFAEGLDVKVDKTKTLVTYGAIAPKLLKQFDIDKPVYYAEINLNLLMQKSAQQNKILFAELPKFPEVKRDLALLLNEDVAYAQVVEVARKTERKLLRRVQLFDVYQGAKLPDGKKSYAVSFTLRDDEKTLVDERIDKIIENLMAAYKRELGAEIR